MISINEEQSNVSKPLGAYLIEAGTIAPEQLEIALQKQSQSGKRLGTILVECGWIKQQTIEYLMENIVLPSRTANLHSKLKPYGNNHLTIVEQTNNYHHVTGSSTSNVKFSLSPKKTTRFLVLLVSSLVLCGLFFQFCVYFLPDYPLRDTFARLFNVNGEQNIPALYSWAALLFCAVLLEVIAEAKKVAGDRYVNYWRVLAVIFVYLSLDEALSIHELFIEPLRNAFGAGGFLYYAWVIPGAIFVVLFLLSFLKFINALPRKTKRLFLIAGTVFVGGAIGMELLAGTHDEVYGSENFTTAILTSIEEFMEMTGVVIFIYGLLSYISSELKGANLNIRIADGKKYQ